MRRERLDRTVGVVEVSWGENVVTVRIAALIEGRNGTAFSWILARSSAIVVTSTDLISGSRAVELTISYTFVTIVTHRILSPSVSDGLSR